jgi:hypothetical protein
MGTKHLAGALPGAALLALIVSLSAWGQTPMVPDPWKKDGAEKIEPRRADTVYVPIILIAGDRSGMPFSTYLSTLAAQDSVALDSHYVVRYAWLSIPTATTHMQHGDAVELYYTAESDTQQANLIGSEISVNVPGRLIMNRDSVEGIYGLIVNSKPTTTNGNGYMEGRRFVGVYVDLADVTAGQVDSVRFDSTIGVWIPRLDGGKNDSGFAKFAVYAANNIYTNDSLFVMDRVGIGTVTPEGQLEIKTASPTIYMDATGGQQHAIHFEFDDNPVWRIETQADSDLVIGRRVGVSDMITFDEDAQFIQFFAGDTSYQFPSDRGDSGQVLKTNASGVLSWADDNVSSGGSGSVDSAGIVATTTLWSPSNPWLLRPRFGLKIVSADSAGVDTAAIHVDTTAIYSKGSVDTALAARSLTSHSHAMSTLLSNLGTPTIYYDDSLGGTVAALPYPADYPYQVLGSVGSGAPFVFIYVDSNTIKQGGLGWGDLNTETKDSIRIGYSGGSTDSFYVAEAAATTTGWKQSGDTIFIDTTGGSGTSYNWLDSAKFYGYRRSANGDTVFLFTDNGDTCKFYDDGSGMVQDCGDGAVVMDSAAVLGNLYLIVGTDTAKITNAFIDSIRAGQFGGGGSGSVDSAGLVASTTLWSPSNPWLLRPRFGLDLVSGDSSGIDTAAIRVDTTNDLYSQSYLDTALGSRFDSAQTVDTAQALIAGAGHEKYDDSGSYQEVPKSVINTKAVIGNVSDTVTADSTVATQGYVKGQGYIKSYNKLKLPVYDAAGAVTDSVVKLTFNNGFLVADVLENGEVFISQDVDDSTLQVASDGDKNLRVKASGITSSHIADNTIDSNDIKDGAVRSSEILNGTIATADLATGARIDSAKYAYAVPTGRKLEADGAIYYHDGEKRLYYFDENGAEDGEYRVARADELDDSVTLKNVYRRLDHNYFDTTGMLDSIKVILSDSTSGGAARAELADSSTGALRASSLIGDLDPDKLSGDAVDDDSISTDIIKRASTSAKGVASFSSTNFDVTIGAVSLKTQGVPMSALSGSGASVGDVPHWNGSTYTLSPDSSGDIGEDPLVKGNLLVSGFIDEYNRILRPDTTLMWCEQISSDTSRYIKAPIDIGIGASSPDKNNDTFQVMHSGIFHIPGEGTYFYGTPLIDGANTYENTSLWILDDTIDPASDGIFAHGIWSEVSDTSGNQVNNPVIPHSKFDDSCTEVSADIEVDSCPCAYTSDPIMLQDKDGTKAFIVRAELTVYKTAGGTLNLKQLWYCKWDGAGFNILKKIKSGYYNTGTLFSPTPNSLWLLSPSVVLDRGYYNVFTVELISGADYGICGWEATDLDQDTLTPRPDFDSSYTKGNVGTGIARTVLRIAKWNSPFSGGAEHWHTTVFSRSISLYEGITGAGFGTNSGMYYAYSIDAGEHWIMRGSPILTYGTGNLFDTSLYTARPFWVQTPTETITRLVVSGADDSAGWGAGNLPWRSSVVNMYGKNPWKSVKLNQPLYRTDVPTDSVRARLPHYAAGIVLWHDSTNEGGDVDSGYLAGYLPSDVSTSDSLIFVYKVANSAVVDSIILMGPTRLNGTNVADSIWYAADVNLTSTSWARVAYYINESKLNAGDYFALKFRTTLTTDSGTLRVAWAEMRVK